MVSTVKVKRVSGWARFSKGRIPRLSNRLSLGLDIPLRLTIAAGMILLFCQTPAHAQLTILHSFGDGSIPNDGAHPAAGLIQGPNDVFFGDTIYQANTLNTLAGTVFQMSAPGKVKILKRFGLTSNLWPTAPLLYYDKKLIGIGAGAVFALVDVKGHWRVRFWHKFAGGANDGANPVGSVVLGQDGNLYGVTEAGGGTGFFTPGIAYKLDPVTHNFSIVYTFTTTEAWMPGATLVQANDGNFYGSTLQSPLGQIGTIFRLTPQGQFTAIYSLFPQTQAPLIQASDGNLYTTIPMFNSSVGSILRVGTSCCGAIIHSFSFPDGINPVGALVQGPDGNLYGVTTAGGAAGEGTIFEISTDGSVSKVVHNFGDGTVPNDGSKPNGGLLLGKDGNLYGTTYNGGSAGLGTVFKFTLTP
ncbi:MAG: hypothetical protein JO077_07860 [Verrucomicrobia bacterium]|nr:hypothetical protein [Verrucomicrobiota bacterium]